MNLKALEHAARHGLNTAEDHRAYCRKKLNGFGTPRRNWREHWSAMLANPKASQTQRRFAEEALRNLSHGGPERVPGEDLEEDAA